MRIYQFNLIVDIEIGKILIRQKARSSELKIKLF